MNTVARKTLFRGGERKEHVRAVAQDILANRDPVIVEIPNLLESDMQAIGEGLRRFSQEVPLKEQLRWEFDIVRDSEYDDEPDDGFMRKKPPKDWKMIFHYRANFMELLRGRKITPSKWQRTWLNHMDVVLFVCTEALKEYVAEMDRLCPQYKFVERAREIWGDSSVLRTLLYGCHKDIYEAILAKEHSDRSGLTITLKESAPGLQVFRDDKFLDIQSPRAPNALMFPGDQFAKITGAR